MIRRVIIWTTVLKDFLISFRGSRFAKYYSIEETISYARDERKSIIRFGDGEFNFINGKGISYQQYDKNLQSELSYILNHYLLNCRKSDYLLCMPAQFLRCSGLKLIRKRVYVSSWSFSRKVFIKNYDKNICYGDAFVFSSGNENIYSKLWDNVNNVIFVHNDIKFSNNFEKKYNKTTFFVKVPKANSYGEKEKILKTIEEVANNIDRGDLIILVSAGPCGKILVNELTSKGLWAIDTGHCWDSPLQNIK